MHKTFLIVASLLGALSVALGAFGAHGLKKIATAETVAMFETGVRYMFYHTFALLLVAILFEKFPSSYVSWAGYCFQLGILLFSGSLFLMTALKSAGTVGGSGIGAITPIGGLFLIAGWLLLFTGLVKSN